MITDPIFYRLFETNPETFFLLLGMPTDEAREMASRYQYQALEFKETSHRVDGVFLPKEPSLPIYFLEVQFYNLPNVYAGLMAKVFTYLKQNNPGQPFCGVVLFASRSLEPKELIPYRHMIAADQIRRYYLEELEELPNAPLGLSILCLIRHAENHAPEVARELIVRVKSEIEDKSLQVDLIDLIETVIIYKLPKLGRAEIQAMLQIHDIRESRVYQEAREEGKVEGLKVGIEKGIAISIAKLAAKNKSLAEIAALLDLNVDQVQQALKNVDRN